MASKLLLIALLGIFYLSAVNSSQLPRLLEEATNNTSPSNTTTHGNETVTVTNTTS